MAMDRAYIDYEKFQQLTERGVIYVTKLKKNLRYTILSDTMYRTPEGLMEVSFSWGDQGISLMSQSVRVFASVEKVAPIRNLMRPSEPKGRR